MVGRNSRRYVLTLVDRASRLVAFELLPSRKMNAVEAAFLRALRKMPAVRTLTLDNAREFACHVSLTKKTGVKVYFADPYCSSQRGSIENANGLLRYYLPKRMDFSFVTRRRLAKIEHLINTRPRKILNYLTAEEMAFKQLSLTQNSVALRG